LDQTVENKQIENLMAPLVYLQTFMQNRSNDDDCVPFSVIAFCPRVGISIVTLLASSALCTLQARRIVAFYLVQHMSGCRWDASSASVARCVQTMLSVRSQRN
jgi:hypothetical protein